MSVESRPTTLTCFIVNYEPRAVFHIEVDFAYPVYFAMREIRFHLGKPWEDRDASEMDLFFAMRGDEWMTLGDPDVKTLIEQGTESDAIHTVLREDPLLCSFQLITLISKSNMEAINNDQLHLLVRLHEPTIRKRTLKLMPAIKYHWRPPQPLVTSESIGSTWDFQSPLDVTDVSRAMRKHYRAWKEDRTDGHCHPIFTCIDGRGTGKSRLLDEFPRLLQEELVSHQAVKTRSRCRRCSAMHSCSRSPSVAKKCTGQ